VEVSVRTIGNLQFNTERGKLHYDGDRKEKSNGALNRDLPERVLGCPFSTGKKLLSAAGGSTKIGKGDLLVTDPSTHKV